MHTQVNGYRFAYNKILEQKNTLKSLGVNAGKFHMRRRLVYDIKERYPFLKGLNARALEQVNAQLHDSIYALSQAKKKGLKVGHIHFKSRKDPFSVTFNQSGYKLDFENNTVTLSKIGAIPCIFHRPLPENAHVKEVELVKTNTEKWYLHVVFQVPDNTFILKNKDRAVGIDVGNINIVSDSSGYELPAPKFYDTFSKRLKRLDRKISKAKLGSNNRRKLMAKKRLLWERITNSRSDDWNKVTKYYIDNFDIIGLEDLNIAKMAENIKERAKKKGQKYSPKNLIESSFGLMRGQFTYKADMYGRKVVFVNPKNTTQICAKCGAYVYKPVYVRTHSCPKCGLVCSRDYNAAINILKLALIDLGVNDYLKSHRVFDSHKVIKTGGESEFVCRTNETHNELLKTVRNGIGKR